MSTVKFLSIVQNIELDATFQEKLIIDINRESIITGGDIPIDPVTIARDTFTIRIDKSTLDENEWNDAAKILVLI